MFYGTSIAQIIPTGGGQGTNSIEYWSRSGNNQNGSNNNIFGTKWNSPIYTVTGGISQNHLRMKINGDFTNPIIQYTINGYGAGQGVNTTGYMLLGVNNISMANGQSIYNTKGAFSLLHLNGIGNSVQEYGYRPWMKTGVTFTENEDLSYMGLRKLSTNPAEDDITETVILWSDNPGSSEGPDKLVFRFSGYGGSDGNSVSANRLSTTDLDGLHVAQFSGLGLMGLGNTFGTNATGMSVANYINPQSLIHLSYDWRSGATNQPYGFGQITYRRDGTNTPGTGETANDGLRWGIDNTLFNQGGVEHLNAYIRWQENTPLIIQTDWDNTPGATNNGERLRFTSVGSLVSTQGSNYGGLTSPTNITRVAISHNGAQPITRPLSLLHLGYNTGLNSNPLGSTDGWRPWMDIGTFTSNGTDNMYVGLKNEGTDRFDAVVSWGDNQSAGPISEEGPDNLRFIFTSTTSSIINPGDPVSSSANGLEVTRMQPGQASTLTNNYGMVGIGNFSSNGQNTAPADAIDAKLDIDGDLRIRTVTQNNSLTRVLVIDENDHNRVHYADIDLPVSNGFTECADTNGAANLLADSKVNLNDYNLYFLTKEQTPLLDKNRVGIGYDCSDNLLGKLSVLQRHYQSVAENTFGGHFSNIDIAAGTSGIGYDFTGVYGEAIGMQPDGIKAINNGGMFFANNASINYGVSSFATRDVSSPNHIGHINIGGVFTGTNGKGQSIGIRSTGSNSDIRNYGVDGFASGTASSIEDIGGNFRAMAPSGLNIGVKGVGLGGDYAIGVYGYADQGTYNYAGYFAGDLVSNQPIIPSDIQFKENISSITSADSLLSLLNPVNYTYKTTGNATRLSFPSGTQIGLIAQEVEQVVPELVREVTHPSDYDSIGNVVNASFNYKTVNYEGIIPLLIASHKEQKSTIDSLFTVNDSLQTQITDLNDRLTQLENCLSGILPFLCQLSQQAIQQNETKTQEELRHFIDVKLNNGTTIVLNQNVPNPFAETTVITYTVPNTVKDAQIVFYDAAGNRIKNVAILERGNGQLNVYGSDLSSGAYTYSLIADGQVVATKRMVKQ